MSVHQSGLHRAVTRDSYEVTPLSEPTHATAELEWKRGAAYLTLLALPLSLRLPTPPAAPLLQRLLGLLGWRGLLPVPLLDQTQAGVHTGQVVSTWA